MNSEKEKNIAIIEQIKKRDQVRKIEPNYSNLLESIQESVVQIVDNQRKFEIKQKKEDGSLINRISLFYNSVVSYFSNSKKEVSWSNLFREQLDLVEGLNYNLASIITFEEFQLERMEYGLNSFFNTSQENKDKLKQLRNSGESFRDDFEEKKATFESLTPDDENYLNARKLYFQSEGKLLKLINESEILETVTRNDLERIDFLSKNISFRRGIVFSAQGLALAVQHINNTLEHLVGSYETMDPMIKCIEGIYEGISTLSGYTQDLQSVYKEAFTVLQKVDSAETDMAMLNDSSEDLDELNSGILDNLQKRIGYENT